MTAAGTRRDPQDLADLLEGEVGPVAQVDHEALALRQPVDLAPHGDPVREIVDLRRPNRAAQEIAQTRETAPQAVLVHRESVDRPIRPALRVVDHAAASQLTPESEQDLLDRVIGLALREALPSHEP